MENNSVCLSCNKEASILVGEFDDYLYCTNCLKYIGEQRGEKIQIDNCCKNSDQHYVLHPIRSGQPQIRKQCNNCGRITTDSISRKSITVDLITIHEENNYLKIEKNRLYLEEKNQLRKQINELIKNQFDSIESIIDSRIEGYNEYIKSDHWKYKRKLVLDRDNYICQSCREAKATQVHHLNYKHFKNEPLFDLVSVCKRCHDIITQLDRYENCDQKIHPDNQ